MTVKARIQAKVTAAPVRVLLSRITLDDGAQVRASISTSVVTEYAEAMVAGALFPPVVLFHDSTRYYVGDGNHRVLAATRNVFVDIKADVRTGTQLDALWYALGANRANGQRLTSADKRHAIELALRTWPEKSQGMIAEQIGCAQSWVSDIGKQLIGSDELTSPTHTIGKDGKRRPARRAPAAPVDAPAPPALDVPQRLDTPDDDDENAIAPEPTLREWCDVNAEGFDAHSVVSRVSYVVMRVAGDWPVDESLAPLIAELRTLVDRLDKREEKRML